MGRRRATCYGRCELVVQNMLGGSPPLLALLSFLSLSSISFPRVFHPVPTMLVPPLDTLLAHLNATLIALSSFSASMYTTHHSFTWQHAVVQGTEPLHDGILILKPQHARRHPT